MTDRSEWQTPQSVMRTSTSPGRGSSMSTALTSSLSPVSSTAARMVRPMPPKLPDGHYRRPIAVNLFLTSVSCQCDVDDMEIDLSQLIAAVEDGADDPLDRIAAAATLKDHLETVGDDLLDHFVRQARDDGASWTQIGEALGVTRQAAQQRHGGFFERLLDRLKEGRMTRFTPRARQSVQAARDAAKDHRHAEVGTEHLLLGLVIDPAAVSTVALDRLGLPAAEATRLVAERFPDGAEARDGRIPFSDPARRALEDSLAIALNLGHNYIGTEHLLIAVAQGAGGGAEGLAAANIAPEAVGRAVTARIGELDGGKGR